jgi:type I restriction enzyme R subunit
MTALYGQNILRVVPELRYSTKKGDRLDLAFFVNGIPVATVELKTNFAQSLPAAIAQYKRDRHPQGEPLLTAGRGASCTSRSPGRHRDDDPARRRCDHVPALQPRPRRRRRQPAERREAADGLLLGGRARPRRVAADPHEVRLHEPREADRSTHRQGDLPLADPLSALSPVARRHRSPPPPRADGPGHRYLISIRPGRARPTRSRGPPGSPPCTPAGDKVFDSVFVIADRQVLDRQLQDAVDQLVTDGHVPGDHRGSEVRRQPNSPKRSPRACPSSA